MFQMDVSMQVMKYMEEPVDLLLMYQVLYFLAALNILVWNNIMQNPMTVTYYPVDSDAGQGTQSKQ